MSRSRTLPRPAEAADVPPAGSAPAAKPPCANDAPPFRFHCRRSGNCCSRPDGFVRVSAADVVRMAAHLGLGERAFRSRYVAASGERLIEGPGARCPFLADGPTTACQIYPVRPARCRTWPFWDELRRSPQALRDAARLCPGIEPLDRGAADGGARSGRAD